MSWWWEREDYSLSKRFPFCISWLEKNSFFAWTVRGWRTRETDAGPETENQACPWLHTKRSEMVVFGKITFTQKILSNVMLTFAWHFTAYKACMLTCLLESLNWRTHRPVVPKVALVSPGEFWSHPGPQIPSRPKDSELLRCMVKCSYKDFPRGAGFGRCWSQPGHCRPCLSPGPGIAGLLSPVLPLPVPFPLYHQSEFPKTHLIRSLPCFHFQLPQATAWHFGGATEWASSPHSHPHPTLRAKLLCEVFPEFQACSRCCVSSISTALGVMELFDYRYI